MSDEKRPVDEASEETKAQSGEETKAEPEESKAADAANASAASASSEVLDAATGANAANATAPSNASDAAKAADSTDAEKPKVKPVPKAAATADAGAADKPKVKPAPKATAAGDAPAKKAPPKKEAPPPDPRAIAAKEMADQIKATIEASLGVGVVEEAGAAQFKSMLLIKKERWSDVVDLLKRHEAWRFDYIEMMAGTDYKDYIEVVILLQSTSLGHCALLKTRTDREKAEIPSLYSVHPGVNWEEREIYDLVGVTFTNHPDLRRIMLWDGFKGHPLRKDYTPWEGEDDPDVAE
jgi:NADH-quinone oxidoreductase subunit C